MSERESSLYPPDQRFGCIPPDLAASRSGLDIYRAMLDGALPPPPVYESVNLLLVEAGEGRTRFLARPLVAHYNPIGTVHGGWIATLLDAALASAVHTMVPAGSGFVTVEFKTNIVRPATVETGDLDCVGEIVHVGRSIATSQARILRKDGKLIAHGVETCSLFPIAG